MQIAAASLSMNAQHQESKSLQVKERLEMWVGQRGANSAPTNPTPATPPRVEVSTAARQRLEADQASAVEGTDEDATAGDPRLTLLRTLVEFMTGRRIETLNMGDFQGHTDAPPAPPQGSSSPAQGPAGYGVAYDYSAHYEETESTRFAAEGEVLTADGSRIRFAVSFQLQRSYSEDVNVSLRLGDAVKKDPLVLDLPGSLAGLTGTRFRFDLEGDGQAGGLSTLSGGLGYLALDTNANGRIDNGTELFGPRSGDGFADLARLDEDGNGWIDEQDSAFARLTVWQPDAQGKGSLQSLTEAGVGALSLDKLATPFALRTASNESLGDLRASGVYLMESGQAASLRQIDVAA